MANKGLHIWRKIVIAASGGLAAVGLAVGAPLSQSHTAPAPHSANSLYPIIRIKPTYPWRAAWSHRQACVRFVFTVNKKGRPENIRVYAHYPEVVGSFIVASRRTLIQWRFHPRRANGHVVATPDVMQEFIYSMRRGKGRYQIMGTHSVFNNQRTETVARETLAWLCAQPLMRKQTIVASQFAEGSSENRNKTHGSPLGQINIAPGMLPERAPPGAARIRFCVDSKGRVADTVIEQSSPRGLYDKLAREVLGKSGFFARKIGNTAVLTCGLTVLMRFSGAQRGIVGKIGKMRFTVLTNVSPVPRLKRQKSVKIALNIPAGTRLPRVARVEIRFCIRKNGTVFEPIVIRAEPKQYFDQAALGTVKEWQFGLLPKPMCDVYEWTRFPLGSR